MTRVAVAVVRAILLGCLLVACAGGRMRLAADDVGYPVSLSQSVYGPSGETLAPSQEDVLGHFSFSQRKWTWLWRAVDLNATERDVSGTLREEIESRGGNAIVNLTVKAKVDPLWYFTSLLPIFPTSCGVTIEGDVVRIE